MPPGCSQQGAHLAHGYLSWPGCTSKSKGLQKEPGVQHMISDFLSVRRESPRPLGPSGAELNGGEK